MNGHHLVVPHLLNFILLWIIPALFINEALTLHLLGKLIGTGISSCQDHITVINIAHLLGVQMLKQLE